MLQQEDPDDFVIATGVTHTVREFLEMVFRHADINVEDHVKFDSRFLRPHEVPILLGDPSKAQKKLGWQASMDLEELSKMMFESDLEEAKIEMLLICKKGESVV
jgi:GDPmannose 4,6-dehydratase